jgi:hypothetical protein
MATRKIRNHLTGEITDAELVNIADTKSTPAVLTLEDGSKLRINMDIYQAARFPNSWDNEGNPVYNLRWGISIVVLDAPDELRRL